MKHRCGDTPTFHYNLRINTAQAANTDRDPRIPDVDLKSKSLGLETSQKDFGRILPTKPLQVTGGSADTGLGCAGAIRFALRATKAVRIYMESLIYYTNTDRVPEGVPCSGLENQRQFIICIYLFLHRSPPSIIDWEIRTRNAAARL
ncbi:hypothetical protein EVAR_99177_1 [Eumeta japonica]|uniref:Uncharacterized protein n=1 Tax=Eumeta variegata TaxID=151549 RepID=A0A4C1YT32_EUMVA|nr:hypothetical protein EVAR_99177_1 [Eumeta japonica]